MGMMIGMMIGKLGNSPVPVRYRKLSDGSAMFTPTGVLETRGFYAGGKVDVEGGLIAPRSLSRFDSGHWLLHWRQRAR